MDAAPTLSHHFGAWLWQKGWLQRIYTQEGGLRVLKGLAVTSEGVEAAFPSTFSLVSWPFPGWTPWSVQNVDGLHLHPSLELPRDVVVECHGSMAAGLVLYGDPLPQHFEARTQTQITTTSF